VVVEKQPGKQNHLTETQSLHFAASKLTHLDKSVASLSDNELAILLQQTKHKPKATTACKQ